MSSSSRLMLLLALVFVAGCAGPDPDHPQAAQHPTETMGAADRLNDAGCVSLGEGRYEQALGQLEQALKLREGTSGEANTNTAATLNNLAVLYSMLGDYPKAQVFARRATEIFRKIEVPEGRQVASSLDNLGNLGLLAGNYAEAESLFERALEIRQRMDGPESKQTAVILDNLGCVYRTEGKLSQARPLFERALKIYETTPRADDGRIAAVLNDLGELYTTSGELAKAEPLLWRALAIAEQRDSLSLLNRVQLSLRNLLAAQGRREQAIFFGKQSVNRLQWMRSQQQPMARELQQSFLKIHADYYRGLAGLLIDAGRLAEAEQVLRMLKEKEYFDFVRGDADDAKTLSATAPLNPEESQAERRYNSLRQQAVALARKLKETPFDSPAHEHLTEQVTQNQIEFEHTLDELSRQLPPASHINRDYLADIQSRQGTLGALSMSSGAPVVLLHFIVTPSRLYILLTTPETQVAATNEIEAVKLNNRIEEFRQVLKNPATDPMPLARALYQILVAPIANDLRQANATTLMVDLDGALRYIPLAALNDGARFLVEQYQIVMYAARCADNLKEQPSAHWQAAGFGLTRQVSGFQPLPWVREELQGIVNVPGSHTGVLPGIIKLDNEFTAAELTRNVSAGPLVIHIASHFVFSPGDTDLSYLVLGNGTNLTLRQMKTNPNLRFARTELLTLSACETGLSGGRTSEGIEVEQGFATLAEQQGAKSVLATLWPVADMSTCYFMQGFYSFRQGPTVASKAAALQKAQLALLKGTAATTAPLLLATRGVQVEGEFRADQEYRRDPHAPYAHPYYWAPFILVGNWL